MEFTELDGVGISPRVERLRSAVMGAKRRVSIEQARLVTEAYRRHAGEPVTVRRALAFAHVCGNITIAIGPDELIVGNRTAAPRAGVVFPEAAVAWIEGELGTIAERPQDPFEVSREDARELSEEILPFWKGRTLEDAVYARCGGEIGRIGKVVKINQRDHAQGHIIPDIERWLMRRPLPPETAGRSVFHRSVAIALDGAFEFIRRYAAEAEGAAASAEDPGRRKELEEIAARCRRLAAGPPETFADAVQSVWFLFVLLHLESNASSFSPGRLDQLLLPYLRKDLEAGRIDSAGALELIECLWIKFNEIVYMRNAHSAEYFAGFPTGFNVCIGGVGPKGADASNELSFIFLKAQEHLGLPQPNLSARLHEASTPEFLDACVRVIARGSGMPQVFNDESVIPALERQGISRADAMNYGVVGCVELSTQGNCLGWSDAAMFNLVKALELAFNHGKCLLTGDQTGPDLGGLDTYGTFSELESAFDGQVSHFVERMMAVCREVDGIHAEILPSPFLSCVIGDCVEKGVDVTAGGARYNLTGIQGIQIANVADSLAAVRELVFDKRSVDGARLLEALRADFEGDEFLRLELLTRAPKYGNDIERVDMLGAGCARRFAELVEGHVNARGGRCHAGFYTVSAHVPMGRNVGATPDGRRARAPLADGGLSAVYGRDMRGPTALLRSVSRVPSLYGSNGTLLNMKFLPSFFETAADRRKFAALLRGLVRMGIHHAQFNVVRREDLVAARKDPERYRGLAVRVAGYTAYFVELAGDLQEEIIARTTFGG